MGTGSTAERMGLQCFLNKESSNEVPPYLTLCSGTLWNWTALLDRTGALHLYLSSPGRLELLAAVGKQY